ncbi:MAG: hypothetical protein JO125_10500 [Chloroflexi bacterium]|nr:hypothetical protein [Ktedonobacteraceae bacterium]MBV8822186.1 hypothetical protein [Ktedonobacteraceae bacterium]MBV9021934.1 hypothetical protein [Ktedonobacteraceae bacterium]MBV9707823.1 hypothetical protein [Chloroflexota bacterium]
MIIQKVKRWLQEMLAWWPWRQAPKVDYTSVVTPMNKGATQEWIVRSTTTEISTPPPGSSSIAVEHAENEASPEPNRSGANEEKPERSVPFRSPVIEEPPSPPPTKKVPVKAQETPPPTYEQRLEFMRYLVKRGLVNEGFEETQKPRQYEG